MKDYYLEDKTRLNGQPKRTIGDYVESQIKSVPARFDSLAEARKNKKAIILRSEHTQDYDGVSGILDSPKLSGSYPYCRGVKSLEEARIRVFEYEDESNWPVYIQYCRLLGIDSQKYVEETSFSIWQYLPGLNRFVSADSAIAGRYHLLSFDSRPEAHAARSYFVFDNGKMQNLYSWKIPEDESDAKRLIEDYENIRQLERFNPNHCPIMEFQTVNRKNYFLQYHIGRDFEPATFKLDRDIQSGETELFLVRGATDPGGLDLTMAIVRPCWLFEEGVQLPDAEDAALANGKLAYDRIMFRRRKFQPFYSNNVEWTCNKISAEHYARDSLFKPKISGIVDVEALVNRPEHTEMVEIAHKTGQTQFKRFNLVSDGRRAFIRRID